MSVICTSSRTIEISLQFMIIQKHSLTMLESTKQASGSKSLSDVFQGIEPEFLSGGIGHTDGDTFTHEHPQVGKESFTVTTELKWSLFTVYFSVFVDYFALSICQPILPFYSEKFNANALELGLLFSSFSLTQTFGAYLMGRISDKLTGRKPMILVGLFGSAIGFAITGFAQDYISLLIYRFITGLFGGTMPVAQAYVTDRVPFDAPNNGREIYLTYILIGYALAAVAGPIVGSAFAEFSIRTPFFAASGVAFIGSFIGIFMLKESHFPRGKNSNKNAKQSELVGSKTPSVAFGDATTSISNDDNMSSNENENETNAADKNDTNINSSKRKSVPIEVYVITLVSLSGSVAFTCYSAMFGIYLIDQFNTGTLGIGIVYLEFGAMYIISSAVIFTNIIKVMNIYFACMFGSVLACAGLVLFTVTSNLYLALTFAQLIAIGWGIVIPALPVIIAAYADDNVKKSDVKTDNDAGDSIQNKGNESQSGEFLAINSIGVNCGFVIGPVLHGIVYDIDKKLMFYESAGFIFFNLVAFCIVYFCCNAPQKANTTSATNTNDNK